MSLPNRPLANIFGKYKSSVHFYEEFNLVNGKHARYSFNDMKAIFHLDGMDQWPKTFEQKDSLVNSLYLVSFMPSASTSYEMEYTLVKSLFHSVFLFKMDHESVDVAMENTPTMALFIDTTKQERRKKKTRQSSLDDASTITDQHYCLAAVNYFRKDQDTVVLWLATTLDEPPVQSIHVTWRNCGFATYLLCLLIKQHTGIADNMTKSVLTAQASLTDEMSSCHFYQCLGFKRYILEDNGLSHTSDAF